MYSYQGYYDTMSGFSLSTAYNVNSRAYWERSLFQRCKALFKFTGLPEQSEKQIQTDYDAFLYALFKIGFLCVFESKKYGIVFQPATPTGCGLQFQPTGMQVTTPFFQFERPLIIGTECELVKLTPDYTGIWDIIAKYAEELMYNDVAIRQSAKNARFAYAMACKDDKTYRTLKALQERLENGDTAIYYDPNAKTRSLTGEEQLPWQQFDRDLKANFIYPELLTARRTILTDFYRELGVQSANGKKERVNLMESTAFEAETFNRRQVWELSLSQSLERVNRLFGTDIRFEYNEVKPVTAEKQSAGGDENVEN